MSDTKMTAGPFEDGWIHEQIPPEVGMVIDLKHVNRLGIAVVYAVAFTIAAAAPAVAVALWRRALR